VPVTFGWTKTNRFQNFDRYDGKARAGINQEIYDFCAGGPRYRRSSK